MKLRTKTFQMGLLLLALLMTLTACGTNSDETAAGAANTSENTSGSDDSDGSAEAKAPVKLKIGVLKIAALADVWVAKQQGIFEKNGIDADLVEFKGGGEAVAAMQSGAVDIILSIPGTAFTAMERGFDMQTIFQNETAKTEAPDSGSMQVLKDSPIAGVKDLKGKKVAVSALHSQNTVAVQQMIKAAGLKLDDVQLLEIPFSSQADALKSKQVDAVVTVDPFTTQLTSSGIGKVIAWPNVETIPGQPLGAWFAKSSFIKNHEDEVTAFTTSLKEAIDYLLADPDRARENVAEYTGLDPALVKEMPMINWDYQVNEANWQAVVDMMVENGEMEKSHQVDEFFADTLGDYMVK